MIATQLIERLKQFKNYTDKFHKLINVIFRNTETGQLLIIFWEQGTE